MSSEDVFYFDDNFSMTMCRRGSCHRGSCHRGSQLWLDLTFENDLTYKFTEISKEKAEDLINFLQMALKEVPSLPKFHEITIVLADCPELVFTGRYCRELETKNWHYYEREDGVMVHLRKDGKGYIIGDSYNNIKGV